MRKISRRLLCALLCACVLAGAAYIPAAAKECGCGEIVQVFMDGYGQALYYDFGTKQQARIDDYRWDQLPRGLWQVVRGAGLSVARFSLEPVVSGISALVNGLLGVAAMDAQGRSIEPITNHWKIDPKQDHHKRPDYRFDFDYRIDPFELAAQLDEFIETLCKRTGHSKIALTCHSAGTIVGTTYLKQYGTKRLETLILHNGVWQGMSLIGEVMLGNIEVSGESLTHFIANEDDGSGNLVRAMELLRASHLLDLIKPTWDIGINAVADQVIDEVFMHLYGTMPAIWTFVPGEYYPEARKLIAGDPKYAALLAMADRYQSEVQSQAGRLLKDAQAKGVKVAVIASYGFQSAPITKKINYHSDTLIDTSYMSGFATTAPLGQTLPPSKSKYRSYDGFIDASTCILPDHTWFIKYNEHNTGPSHELRQWIIRHSGQPSVWSSRKWPQYLVNVDGRAGAPALTR